MFISASGNKITVSLWTNYRVLLHVPPDRADIPCYLYLCRVTPPRSLCYISDILSKSRLLYRGTFRGGIHIPYCELACNAVWPSGTVGISDTAYTCCCCSAYPWTFHSEKWSRKKNDLVNEDFRYMKIHIFALRWKDEIKRSSQLRNTTETSSC